MRRRSPVLPCLLLLACACACARPVAQQPYDVVVTGGSVLNGEGTPAVRADVGIRGGRIATIGDLRSAAATRRIDASGLTVAPGFIDIHNHSDYTILVEPKSESMIRQGVTTMVLGESRSAGPIKPGAEEARARAPTVSRSTGPHSAATLPSSNRRICRRTSPRTSARSRCGRT